MTVLALGDSIALGTGHALHAATVARVGASSCAIYGFMPPVEKIDLIALSAGVNDPPGTCIEKIRARLHGKSVIWILPPPVNSARAHIAAVAAKNGDRTISYVPGKDGLHPRSYKEVARQIK